LTYFFKPFSFDTGFSYVRSKLLGANADPDYFDAFPRYILQNGITYEAPKEWTLYLNNRLFWNMSEATGDYIPHSNRLPPYWRVDFSVSKTFGDKLQLSAVVRNLFDRHNAKPSLFSGEGGIPEYGTNFLVRFGYLF
jgi:outer membrane receptor protein involved in Fe transport